MNLFFVIKTSRPELLYSDTSPEVAYYFKSRASAEFPGVEGLRAGAVKMHVYAAICMYSVYHLHAGLWDWAALRQFWLVGARLRYRAFPKLTAVLRDHISHHL